MKCLIYLSLSSDLGMSINCPYFFLSFRARINGYDRKEDFNMDSKKNKLRTEVELLSIKSLLNLASGHVKEAQEAIELRNKKAKLYAMLEKQNK